MRFFPIGQTSDGTPLTVCRGCAAVIADDAEGANRGDHEEFHASIERSFRAAFDAIGP